MLTAHSGSNKTKDNSYDYFYEFIDKNIDCLEVDVRKNNTGELYLSHDALKENELKDIVLLKDLFSELKKYSNKYLNCDLKEENLEQDVMLLAKEFNIENQIIFSGTVKVENIKDDFKNMYFDIFFNIENIFEDFYKNNEFYLSNKREFVKKVSEYFKKHNLSVLNINYKFCDDEMIQLFKDNEIELSLWTVDNEEKRKEFMKKNVHNITTREAIEAIEERELMVEVDINLIIEIIKEASYILRNESYIKDIYSKGIADFVTQADYKIQDFIKNKLSENYSHIQFMGEENNEQNIDVTKEYWVLDPVDGTTNLIHDYKFSAISIALINKQEVILGVVYQPYLDEVFYAIKNEGSFLNGERIYVSNNNELSSSLIAIGTSPYNKEEAEENFEIFKNVFKECKDIRRSGSAALDIVYTACGRIDAYFEKNVKLWDYAAGSIIVKEAGGKIVDFYGNKINNQLNINLVSGQNNIVDELVDRYLK